MDNFDEFEFKPITDGLGFHNKTSKNNKNETSNSAFSVEKLTATGRTSSREKANVYEDTFNADSSFTKVELEEELYRRRPASPSASARSPVPPTVKTQPQFVMNNHVEFSQAPETKRVEVPISMPAAIFDGIVIVGLTLLFAFTTLLVAQVDPLVIITMLSQDFWTQISVGVLVFSVAELYMLISRGFFGQTLGEWSFEVEVGTGLQQKSLWYPFQVVLRTLLTTATGFVLLPLLSLIVRRDIAGMLSGIKLQRTA